MQFLVTIRSISNKQSNHYILKAICCATTAGSVNLRQGYWSSWDWPQPGLMLNDARHSVWLPWLQPPLSNSPRSQEFTLQTHNPNLLLGVLLSLFHQRLIKVHHHDKGSHESKLSWLFHCSSNLSIEIWALRMRQAASSSVFCCLWLLWCLQIMKSHISDTFFNLVNDLCSWLPCGVHTFQYLNAIQGEHLPLEDFTEDSSKI